MTTTAPAATDANACAPSRLLPDEVRAYVEAVLLAQHAGHTAHQLHLEHLRVRLACDSGSARDLAAIGDARDRALIYQIDVDEPSTDRELRAWEASLEVDEDATLDLSVLLYRPAA